MEQSLDDIAELAEELGKRNLIKGIVNLKGIAKRKGIELIFGHYEDYFVGELVHCSGKFYIHLNMDKLTDKKSARARFTIAHELGHYFIDSHRTKLTKGISLSYAPDLSCQPNKKIERQANHFASNLLMPKTKFMSLAKKNEPGIAAILDLRKRFDTSIECTAHHYVNLNLTACVMLKWKPDFSFQYSNYSRSFSKLTGIKWALPVKFNSEYVNQQIELVESTGLDYYETVTPISRWVSTVLPGSQKDIIGLEQTIKLGEFGGITLLTFVKQ